LSGQRSGHFAHGAIRFQATQPLLAAFVRKLVKSRIKENAARRKRWPPTSEPAAGDP
jgi:hypothetical protein